MKMKRWVLTAARVRSSQMVLELPASSRAWNSMLFSRAVGLRLKRLR